MGRKKENTEVLDFQKKELHCFRCERYLGDWMEQKKMDTEMGPICYNCFNEVQAEAQCKAS